MRQFALEAIDQQAAIGQAGERVVVGQAVRALLVQPSLGDVGDEAVPQHAAIGQALRHRVTKAPPGALLRQHDAVLVSPRQHVGGRGLDGIEHGLHVLRMDARDDAGRVVQGLFRVDFVHVPHALAGVREAASPVRVEPELVDDAWHAVRELAQQLGAVLQLVQQGLQARRLPAQIQLGHDLPGQQGQGLALVREQPSGLAVDDTQGAQGQAIVGDQGRPGVKADERIARDQRVAGEARVRAGVFDHHDIGLPDGVVAEGEVARRAADIDAHPGLEPLPVAVDEADQGNGHAQDLGSQLRQVIEGLFGGGVENTVASQGRQPAFLVIVRAFRQGGHGQWQGVHRF